MYHIFCIHSSVEGHLGCFQFLDIKNRAAMNIVEHVSLLHVGSSSGYMPRSGIVGSSGTLLHCWWDYKLVQPLWKSVWWFLRKLYIVLLVDPAIPLLGIYSENIPTGYKDTCSTMFIAALFIIARSYKAPRCPSTEEWLQKMCNLLNGVLLSY